MEALGFTGIWLDLVESTLTYAVIPWSSGCKLL